MNISQDLYCAWKTTCLEVVGKTLPINQIGMNFLSHAVLAEDPPLITCSGEAIRIVQLKYKLKDYKNELPN
jgi:hypothetical protein